MKKCIKNLLRLIWYIPYRLLKFLRLGKVLHVPIGWDTLYPLAPYSEGGLSCERIFWNCTERERLLQKNTRRKSLVNI